jgi:hypothetical protein
MAVSKQPLHYFGDVRVLSPSIGVATSDSNAVAVYYDDTVLKPLGIIVFSSWVSTSDTFGYRHYLNRRLVEHLLTTLRHGCGPSFKNAYCAVPSPAPLSAVQCKISVAAFAQPGPRRVFRIKKYLAFTLFRPARPHQRFLRFSV